MSTTIEQKPKQRRRLIARPGYKYVECAYAECGARRIHRCDPFTPRGTRRVEVPEDYTGPTYCSYSCAIQNGAMELNYDHPDHT